MKYNPHEFDREMICEVQVTLRIDDYVGHIWYKHMGEAYGKYALCYDFECTDCDEDFYRNDCDLHYVQDFDVFYAKLKDDKGDVMHIEGESAEFMNELITAVEIIGCYEEDDCHTKETCVCWKDMPNG